MAQTVSSPDSKQPLVTKLLGPFEDFVRKQSFGGLLLLAAAAAALVLANSPLSSWYFALRDAEVHFSVAGWSAHMTIQHMVNDGLMALFFFVVGLEIKRELLIGELNSLKRAALPIAAAIGGMVVPAVVFAVFNYSEPSSSGWAIPMATDIAFALGILALLGWRVPLSARIFLTSIAIIDDLGAVLVIALFYSGQLVLQNLASAAFLYGLLVLLNRIGVQSAIVYGFVGFWVWVALLGSGIHATIAGVLVASAIPVMSRIDPEKFQQISQIKLLQFADATAATSTPLLDHDQQKAVHELRSAVNQVQPPMSRLQHLLHPWSTYLIMPAFAFFNAGLALANVSFSVTPLTAGIGVGLLIGKPTGILFASWVAIKCGWAVQPDLSKVQFVGLSFLAGIGFTMSLFIANLAFAGHEDFINSSTAAIMVASVVSACTGALLLYQKCAKSLVL